MIEALKRYRGEITCTGNDEYKVTIRRGAGKAHRAYADGYGFIRYSSCSCPGSQSGRIIKGASIIANGWQSANCGN
jgi:hypothetical protein